jgi:acyl-coenzyme A thioesterase PaaI-like protein
MVFAVEPPGLVGTFRPRPDQHGPPGFLHGGVAASCLDETMARLSYVLDRVHSVTGTLELRYRLPVPLDGRAVRVEAWPERAGPARMARRVRGRMLLADGSVAVEARGLFVQVRT